MATSIVFFVTTPKAAISSIRCEVNYTHDALSFPDSKRTNGKRFQFSTTISGFKVKPEHFHGQRVNYRAPNARAINDRLELLTDRVTELHARFIKETHFPSPERFKIMLLTGDQVVTVERNMLSDFAEWLQFQKDKRKPRTNRDGKTKRDKYVEDCQLTLKRLTDYMKFGQKQPYYSSISTPFLAGFDKYLGNLPGVNKKNTVAKYLERLKNFLNFAIREKWTANDTHRTYHVETWSDPFPVVLTEAEIEALCSVDLSHYSYRRRGAAELTIDCFILATQTGARFGDWGAGEIITTEGGFNLRMEQEKTIHPLEIPLSETAMKIIRKYKGRLPKPLNTNATLTYIQEVCDHLGFGKKVTTHTARRTCCTLLVQAGVPESFVMRISGHKTEKQFRKYIGTTHAINAELIRQFLPEKYKLKTA